MAQIKKISDGKYLIRSSRGTGKSRTFVNKTFYGTLKEAKAEAREMDTDIQSGRIGGARLRFERFFELWIKAITPKLQPRTVDGYDGYIRRYALELLKNYKLTEIETHHIQEVYNATQKSSTTVRNLHASLNACFSWAVKHEYIRHNPCRHTDRPAKVRPEIVVMDAKEVAKFVGICGQMRLGVLFEFALETGMRPEEYLALRWSDVSGCEVSVAQAVQFNRKGGGYYFKDIKTKTGRRRISISERLRQRLVTHRRETNEHRLAMKGTWFNHDLVFPNEIGRPMQLPNVTRRYLKPILDKCNFTKHITLYSLRHTCATLLLMDGKNPKTVSDRLGHASVTLTLDVYSHILPHIQDEATDAMDRIMRGIK